MERKLHLKHIKEIVVTLLFFQWICIIWFIYYYYYYYTYAWLNKKKKIFLLINNFFQGGFNVQRSNLLHHNKRIKNMNKYEIKFSLIWRWLKITLLSQRRDVDEILEQVQPRNQVPIIAFILARGRHMDKYPPSQLPSENREPDETVVRPPDYNPGDPSSWSLSPSPSLERTRPMKSLAMDACGHAPRLHAKEIIEII